MKSILRHGMYVLIGMIVGVGVRVGYDAGYLDGLIPEPSSTPVSIAQVDSPPANIRPVAEVDVYVRPDPNDIPPPPPEAPPPESTEPTVVDAGPFDAEPEPSEAAPPQRRANRTVKPYLPRARVLGALAERLDMPGATVSIPCRRYVGTACVEGALDAFFSALDAAAAGQGRARAMVLGNSLIASDRIVDVWREHFVHQFGDAGRGFLLTDRMAEYGPRYRTAKWASGFRTHNIAMGEFGRYPHGVAGVLHVAEKGISRAIYPLKGETRATLFWHAHKRSPAIEVSVDGEQLAYLTERSGGPQERTVDLGADKKKLIVKTSKEAVLYGVSLEKDTPGFMLDTMGVPAVDAKIFMRSDEQATTQQVHKLKPDLVTFLLGGNEIKRIAWGKEKKDRIVPQTRKLIARMRSYAPTASCLVIGPIENVRGKNDKRPFKTRWQTPLVIRLLKQAAHLEGCAFIDLFAAMGGEGALKRLDRRNMLHDDLVHPKGQGLDLPGDLIAKAMLDAYQAAPTYPPPDTHSGVVNGDQVAWANVGDKVAERGTVRIKTLDSADPAFAQAVFKHLNERLGEGGRAFTPISPAPRVDVEVPSVGDTVHVYFKAKTSAAANASPRIASSTVERIKAGLYRMSWPRRAGPRRVTLSPSGNRAFEVLGVYSDSPYGAIPVADAPAPEVDPLPFDIALGSPGCARGVSLPQGAKVCFDAPDADKAAQMAMRAFFGT